MLEIVRGQNSFENELLRDPSIRSEHTRRGYSSDLEDFTAWADGRPTTKILVEQFASECLQDGLAASTVNRKLSSVRWACRRAVDVLLDAPQVDGPEQEARQRFIGSLARIATVKGIRSERPLAGRLVQDSEILALMRACAEGTNAGTRDGALIAVLRGTGCRRAELCALTMADVSIGTEEVELRLHTKGNKQLKTFLFDGARLAFLDWARARGDAPGFVFLPVNRGDNIRPGKLSGEAVRLILQRRSATAGINPFTPHDLRRSLISGLLDAGVDLVTISQVVNHSNTSTTARYDRRPESQRKSAMQRAILIPYFGEKF